jgi:hypothetical protein
LDILVDMNRFFETLCKCEKCSELYSDKNISFISSKEQFIDDWNNRELLEDKLDEQANLDNEENREIISKIDNFDINMLPEVREMPIEKVNFHVLLFVENKFVNFFLIFFFS